MSKETLKPADDIEPLTVRDFDRYHAMLRTLYTELLPSVLAAHYPSALRSPVEFDCKLAAAVRGQVSLPADTLDSAVGWYRCTAWLDPRKPAADPPDGFDTTGLQLRGEPTGYTPEVDQCPPHIEHATASAFERCTTAELKALAKACDEHRGAVMATLPLSAFVNLDAVDLVMQATMVARGPAELRGFSEERPTVFDIFSSCHRYRPELVAMQRGMLLRTENGSLTIADAAATIFDRIAPNSHEIKQER